ncbi:Rpn family recombination-promoting nuclease/putative transposase [Escherichia albertii]
MKTLKLESSSFIDDDLRESYSDVLWSVKYLIGYLISYLLDRYLISYLLDRYLISYLLDRRMETLDIAKRMLQSRVPLAGIIHFTGRSEDELAAASQ